MAELSGEEKLWRTVICLAVRDASISDAFLSAKCHTGTIASSIERRDALVFIYKSRYFYDVCLMAGVSAARVREVCDVLIGQETVFSLHAIHSAIWGERADWLPEVAAGKNRMGQSLCL